MTVNTHRLFRILVTPPADDKSDSRPEPTFGQRSSPSSVPAAKVQQERERRRGRKYDAAVSSSLVSRISSFVLGASGVALLFAPDVILPALVPGFPAAAAWLGQLLAAAWLAIAALNWLQRSAVLGGIYGRAVVLANLVLYFVTALSVGRALAAGTAPASLWALTVPAAVLAVAYGALLLRGPFDLQRPAG